MMIQHVGEECEFKLWLGRAPHVTASREMACYTEGPGSFTRRNSMSDSYESSRLDRPERLLRFAEVRARIGLSKSEIYRRIAAGTFPASVKLGARAVAWRESAVEAWIRARR